MLRLSLFALGAVVVLLIVLSLLPERKRNVPASLIELENASVTLYPQADPEAVWHFRADRVDYEPTGRETTLYDIKDSERVVNGETDFSLESDRVMIDAQDNLRGERILVHLIDANWDLDMQAKDGRSVLIDQGNGKFIVPVLDYTGDGVGENHVENVRTNFDLTDFEVDCEAASCFNQIEDDATR